MRPHPRHVPPAGKRTANERAANVIDCDLFGLMQTAQQHADDRTLPQGHRVRWRSIANALENARRPARLMMHNQDREESR